MPTIPPPPPPPPPTPPPSVLKCAPLLSTARILLVLALAALASLASLAARHPALAQPAEPEPAASTARETFLPALEGVGADGAPCSPEIVIQSVADEPRKAILLFWGAPGPSSDPADLTGGGALKVECTGLIRPGTSWRVSGPMIPAGARSAVVYSVTTEFLTDIGVHLEFDDIVADYLCETLFFSVVGDRADTLRFRHAVREGGEFAGVPMDRAVGAPLAVSVDRTCSELGSRYSGIAGDAAQRAPSAPGAPFAYSSPWLGGAPASPGDATITAMNTGLADARVEAFAAASGRAMSGAGAECPAPTACGIFSVAPGESIVVDPAAAGCAPGDGRGRAWIESSEPLAVIVDGSGPAPSGRASAAARRADDPPPPAIAPVLPAIEHGIDVLAAPLVYHEYRGWSTIVHVANHASDESIARLSVLHRSGDVIVQRDFALCPRGALSIDLDAEFADLPGNLVGALRVESVAASSASGAAAPPDRIGAVVEFVKRDPAGATVASAAYDVLPAADGDVLIGIPSLAKAVVDRPTTRLAIQNRASAAGFTDYVIYLYDNTGLLDYVCNKVNERQVDYIDLATWGYVNPGFVGSAILSATYWEHDLFDTAGGFAGNRAALAVVAFDVHDAAPASLGAPADSPTLASAIMPPPLHAAVGPPLARVPACTSGPFIRPTPSPERPAPGPHGVYLPWSFGGAATPETPAPIFP